MKILLLALAVSAVSAYQLEPSCDKPLYCNSKLLHHVQMARIFPESKTFVDFRMKNEEKCILNDFDVLLKETNNHPSKQQLQVFLTNNFESFNELENWTPEDFVSEPSFLANIKDIELRNFAKNIHNIWPLLGRKVKPIVREKPENFSMIPVQNGFIIPGIRFKELYYWDTYWIIEGLLVSGMKDTVKGILSNLVDLQRQFGHIPNGNRWYFQQRSQPPLLSAMVMKYIEATHDVEFLKSIIDALEGELQYWIDTQSVVFKIDGKEHTLLRYFTPSKGPRPEWYYEDYTQAQSFGTEERQQQYFNDIKSAAESGWDFSSRWFINQNGTNIGNLTSTHASHIVPVDLNAIFARSMRNMAYYYSLIHNSRKGAHWAHIAKQWGNSIKEVMWNHEDGIWYDWDLSNSIQRKYFYPSNIAPLWMEVVDTEFINEHAPAILAYMKKTHSLEFPGGIPTSFYRTGQKWDYPYAWAPLVSMVVKSLENLKTQESEKLALDVVKNWVRSNLLGYNTYKQLFDKYDVEAPGKLVEEEEYAVQAGFGWTNGATLQMLAKYGEVLKSQDDYYNFHTYKSNPIFWHIPTSAYLPSYYKTSKTAPVLTELSPFYEFVSTYTNTYNKEPIVASLISNEHSNVAVSGQVESITLNPSIHLKPEEPAQIPPIPTKPELIPSAEVKPELISTTYIKPQLISDIPVQQDQISSSISFSQHGQSVHSTGSVQNLPAHPSEVFVSGEQPAIHFSSPLSDEKIKVTTVSTQTLPTSVLASGSSFTSGQSAPHIEEYKNTLPSDLKPTISESVFTSSFQSSKPEITVQKEIVPPKTSVDNYVSEHYLLNYTHSQPENVGEATSQANQSSEFYQTQHVAAAIPQPENTGIFVSVHNTTYIPGQAQFAHNTSLQTGFSVSYKPDEYEKVSLTLPQSGNLGSAVYVSGYPDAARNTTSNFPIEQAQVLQSSYPLTGFPVDYKPVQTEKISSTLTQTGNIGGVLSSNEYSGASLSTASNFTSLLTNITVTSKPSLTEKDSQVLTQFGNVGGALFGGGFPETALNTASSYVLGQSSTPQSSFSVDYKPVVTENVSGSLAQTGNLGGALSASSGLSPLQHQGSSSSTGFSVSYKPVETEKVSSWAQADNVGGVLSVSGLPGDVLNTASNFTSGQAQLEQSFTPAATLSVGNKPTETQKVSASWTQSGNVGGALSETVQNTANTFASGQAQFDQSSAPVAGFSIGYKPVETEKVSALWTESGNVGGVPSGTVQNIANTFASGQAQLDQNSAPVTGFSIGYKPVETEKVSASWTQTGNIGGALSGTGSSGVLLDAANNLASGQANIYQSSVPEASLSVGYKPVETEKASASWTQTGNIGGVLSGSKLTGAVLNTSSNFATGQAQLDQNSAPAAGFSVGYKPVETEKVSASWTQSGNVGGALSGSELSGTVQNTASNFASGQAQLDQSSAPVTGFSVGYKPVETEKVSASWTQTGNIGGALSGTGSSGAVLNAANNLASGQAHIDQNSVPVAGLSVGYKPVETEKVAALWTQTGNIGGALSSTGSSGAILNTASNFASGQAQLGQSSASLSGFSIGYKPVETEKVSASWTQTGNFGGALSGSGYSGAVLNTASNFASGQAQLGQSSLPVAGFSVNYKPVETEKVSASWTQTGNVGGPLPSSGLPVAVINTASNFASGQTQLDQSSSQLSGFSVGYKPITNEKATLTQTGNVGGALSGGFPAAVINAASNLFSGHTSASHESKPAQYGRAGLFSGLFG